VQGGQLGGQFLAAGFPRRRAAAAGDQHGGDQAECKADQQGE